MNLDIIISESHPVRTPPAVTTLPPNCQGWQIERHLCLRPPRSQAVLPQVPALESVRHNPVLVPHPLKDPQDRYVHAAH